MKMTKYLSLLLGILPTAPLCAQWELNEADGYRLIVVTDRPDALYARGDEIRFIVTLEKDGAPVSGDRVAWCVTKDTWDPKTEGQVAMRDGKAVLGGNVMEGGKGSVPGAVLGALTLYTIRSAMSLMGIDTSWVQVVIGGVLVIGMLLNHQKDPLIVASTQKGILQHDAFTWEVMGPSFIEKESLTRRAAASDRSLHKWIDHMDERQREHLIGELFSVLEATGAETISQIQDGGLKSLAAMVRQLDKLEPRSKIMVQELIAGIFGSWLELLPLPELDKKRFLP